MNTLSIAGVMNERINRSFQCRIRPKMPPMPAASEIFELLHNNFIKFDCMTGTEAKNNKQLWLINKKDN
jgi:hypothetical protein